MSKRDNDREYPTLQDVDLSQGLPDKDEYRRLLKTRQLQMLLIQRHMYEKRRRAVIAFEGWDAAGKGGSIRRLVERLDPRGFTVHPIGAPTPEERGRLYLHRFWTRLPPPGGIALFDRSWYGRVLVERVEKLCAREQWQRAYGEINAFEKMLVDDGAPVIKIFLHISEEEQLKRFEARKDDPFKGWKLTEEDWRNRARQKDYAKAINDMVRETSTPWAPWHIVPSERKWFGRVEVLRVVCEALSKTFDLSLKLPKGWRKLPD